MHNKNNAVNTLVSNIRDNELINIENNLYNKNYKNLLDIKNWLIKILANNEQNEINNFIFMTFRYNQSLLVKKNYIIKELMEVLRILNRKLLGRNWINNKRYFKFVFSIEHGSFGTLHTHLIINIRHITYKDFLNKLLEISKLIKYDIGTKENNCKIEMLTSNKYSKNIVITELYSNNVYNYILKEFRLLTADSNSLNFDNLMNYKDIYYSKTKN